MTVPTLTFEGVPGGTAYTWTAPGRTPYRLFVPWSVPPDRVSQMLAVATRVYAESR